MMKKTKKILFVANIFKHLKAFHLPYIDFFKENGWQVDLMAGGEDLEFDNIDNKFHINVQRSPFSFKNFSAYKQAKKIIDNGEYDIVYCHTAMAAVIARLASLRNRKLGKTKVIYVAHGFHFCKGSPISYWLMYYPVEKFLSYYTDTLVTINEEDYQCAKRGKFGCGALYKINGIGVDLERFAPIENEYKCKLRQMNNLSENDFVLIYTAEHNFNKNHKIIIDATKVLVQKIQNIKVLFAGEGIMLEQNQHYAKSLGLERNIAFLGFRNDIPSLVSASDIVISTSRREGLGLNIIEGLANGRPVVATKNRGHNELIEDGVNGFLTEQGDLEGFVAAVLKLYDNRELYNSVSMNANKSVQKYSINNSLDQIKRIFEETLK